MIAVYKEAGIASAPDPSGDRDAMAYISEILHSENEPCELYVVHRLDRVVGGVLVYARNKEYAAKLSALVADGAAEKVYLAVVEGEADGGAMKDYLYKDSRLGKAFVADKKKIGAKKARLEYALLGRCDGERGIFSLVKIRLQTGRFHQIRAQFSHRKLTIVGDGKYGSKDIKRRSPSLFASRLAFSLDGKKYEFKKMPEGNEYPWSCFKELL